MKARPIRIGAGLIGASVLVLLALAGSASASSTRYLVADQYPAEVKGSMAEVVSQESLQTNIPITCSNSSIQASLNSPTDEPALESAFTGCKGQASGSSVELLVKTNGCKFVLHPATINGEGGVNGTVDIGPSGCGPISISGVGCSQQIPAQNNVGSASYEALGSGKTAYVNIRMTLTGLKYTSSGIFCGTKEGTNGSFTGGWRASGFDPEGVQIGIHMDERRPDGVYLAGKEGEAGNLPRLEAERFPVLLNGEQTGGKFALATKGGTLKCPSATLAGSASSASGTIAGTPAFGSCTLASIYGSIAETVSVNGCTYGYSVAGGPSYTGQLTLSCPSGNSLVAKGPGCTVTIPAQTLGSVTYGSTGSGPYRAVTESVSGKNIQSSSTGFFCSATGSDEAGTFAESGTIRGSTE
jgi:hypothetical protein